MSKVVDINQNKPSPAVILQEALEKVDKIDCVVVAYITKTGRCHVNKSDMTFPDEATLTTMIQVDTMQSIFEAMANGSDPDDDEDPETEPEPA